MHSKVAPTRTVAAWLSGFYSGKRDNRVIDLQNFEANLSKLENFCYEESLSLKGGSARWRTASKTEKKMEPDNKEETAAVDPAVAPPAAIYPIAELSFRVAKTMPEIPHEYVVRTPENEAAYVALFNLIVELDHSVLRIQIL